MARDGVVIQVSSPVQIQFSQLLKATDIFAKVNDEYLEFIAEVCQLVKFEAGVRIVHQGEQGDELFIIGEGRVAVIHEEPAIGTEQLVTTLGPSQSFGETSLLTNAPRSATIRALEETICVVLGRQPFESVMQRVPEVSLEVCRYLAANLHHQCQLTGFRFFPLQRLLYDADLYGMFPPGLLKRIKAIPLKVEENTLLVALVNPYQTSAVKQLREAAPGYSIEAVVCSREDYETFLRRNRPPSEGEEAAILGSGDVSAPLLLPNGKALEPPLSTLIREALNRDITHILVEADRIVTPRERELHSFVELPNPAEHEKLNRQLQESFFSQGHGPEVVTSMLSLEPNFCHLELSRVVTTQGPRFSIHLVESRSELPSASELFPDWKMRERVFDFLQRRGQAVVLAGPMLSGLSSTAYSILSALHKEHGVGNMLSIESNPFSNLSYLPQVPMGESFEADLKAVLVQSPSLLLVDEIECQQLPSILRQIHNGPSTLVCLRSNSPLQELSELARSGELTHTSLDGLGVVIQQELLPRLCPHCRSEYQPSGSVLNQLEKHQLCGDEPRFFQSQGCDRCYGSGISGKVALLEVLMVNEMVREFLLAGRQPSAIRKIAERNFLLSSFHAMASGLMAQGELSAAVCLRFFSTRFAE